MVVHHDHAEIHIDPCHDPPMIVLSIFPEKQAGVVVIVNRPLGIGWHDVGESSKPVEMGMIALAASRVVILPCHPPEGFFSIQRAHEA